MTEKGHGKIDSDSREIVEPPRLVRKYNSKVTADRLVTREQCKQRMYSDIIFESKLCR